MENVQCNIEYHLVWTTKYRFKLLTGVVAQRCREIIKHNCDQMEIDIIKGIINKDYVHILISCPPNISITQIIKVLKKETSKLLLNEYKDLQKKCGRQQIWNDGYFCQTVGEVNNSMIIDFINNQTDDNEIFKIID